MTQKLETLLDIEQLPQKKMRAEAKQDAAPDNVFTKLDEFDKISAALPQVKGLGKVADDELDALASRATMAYDDLMDLGMNVEPRYSGRIFEVASSMLKNAIDAKSAKLDKKLKMIELQLKKQKLDMDNAPKEEKTITGEGYLVTDRNSLLEKLKNLK